MRLRFSPRYAGLFAALFLIELTIALFIKDSVVRPFIGDILVIMLIYFFMQTFFSCNTLRTIIGVLVFSYLVEFGQYFHLVKLLHLQDVAVANIVIGSTYDAMDLVAYTIGAFLLWIASQRQNTTSI